MTFAPRSTSISPYEIASLKTRPDERTVRILCAVEDPWNAPVKSAVSTSAQPRKTPLAATASPLQPLSRASTVPSTKSRSQDLITPGNEILRGMVSVLLTLSARGLGGVWIHRILPGEFRLLGCQAAGHGAAG